MPDPLPEAFMRRAVELAHLGFPAPNPRVGCVIVRGGQIVGEGYHARYGTDHAEVVALKAAGDLARGADVYVTLEPCNHFGQTPPCSLALIEAGVKRVFVAVSDPNPVAAGGLENLRSHGIDVSIGLLAIEASVVNERFLTAMMLARPFVLIKAAVTADGFACRLDGTSKWITGEEARADARRMRAEMGCVLVGSGTVLADDPSLTARLPDWPYEPIRVVLDRRQRLTGREKIFSGPGVTHVLTGLPDWSPLGVLSALKELKVTGAMVEGGPQTWKSFLDAGLADQILIYQAEVRFGEGKPWYEGGTKALAEGFKLVGEGSLGPDVRFEYRPKKPERNL